MLLLAGGGFQRVRAHLYGALLYYLQTSQKPDEPDTLETGMIALYMDMIVVGHGNGSL